MNFRLSTRNAILTLVIAAAALSLMACGDNSDKTGDGKGGNGGGKISDKITASSLSSDVNAKVIYGSDNRLDVYAETDPKRRALADSTVALIISQNVQIVGATANLATVPFNSAMGTPLCPTERFRDQYTSAFCSGFLIAPNVIATAGHCITSDQGDNNECSQTKIVFGFAINYAGEATQSVPASEVYSCAKILKREQLSDGQDYAVIQLDRAVTNHHPLKLRASGDPALTDELMVIGHPSGLPTKIADGAVIRFVHSDYLRASLDTYGGNSGSAVFNTRTNEVEGILVRGEQDFVYQNNCLASKVCGQNDCRGEDVTRISYAVPYGSE